MLGAERSSCQPGAPCGERERLLEGARGRELLTGRQPELRPARKGLHVSVQEEQCSSQLGGKDVKGRHSEADVAH